MTTAARPLDVLDGAAASAAEGGPAEGGPAEGGPAAGGPAPTQDLIATVFARDCTSRATLEDVAGKWGILALLALGESDHRFNALRRRVDGVSEKMLSQTLQTLERDGMVVRDVRTTIPPRVEYSLTPLGIQVATRLRGLADLLEASVEEVLAARAAFDSSARRR